MNVISELAQTVVGRPHYLRAATERLDLAQAKEAPAEFAGFRLVSQLGKGAEGAVYLAIQPELAQRQVVLKITDGDLEEHLSLARLQHTNIVPLYGVYENPAQRQRALCMPYFGAATLQHLFNALAAIPPAKRRGSDIADVLERMDSETPVVCGSAGAARLLLKKKTYVQAVCWIGACLADALGYAHQRGLVHFDIKPSNVLLAADGQPMLLDFHLARPPLKAGEESPAYFGGTPPYMPAEQEGVCEDVMARRSLRQGADGRSDIYALGVLLRQALSGTALAGEVGLRRLNPRVSRGLADIIAKCVAADPAARYATAAALATDLRSHLDDRPLQGVKNRSLGERYAKWRRRRPYALPLAALLLGLVAAIIVAGSILSHQRARRRQTAEEYFREGQSMLRVKQYAQAVESFKRGLNGAEGFYAEPRLLAALKQHLALAERARRAEDLHRLAEQCRLVTLADNLDLRAGIVLDRAVDVIWEQRQALLEADPDFPDPALEETIRRDLLELAIHWADIKVRIGVPERRAAHRGQARAILAAAARIGGETTPLAWERGFYADEPDARRDLAGGGREIKDPWEHYCLGRALLRHGDVPAAFAELEKSLSRAPADYWANFVLADCAARLGRHDRAIACLGVCIGQNPTQAESFLRRGRAYAQLKDWDGALRDFNWALDLRPNAPEALLERARVYRALGQEDRAERDFEQARQP